jgi:soluble lytic murein transglycosylase-like protein
MRGMIAIAGAVLALASPALASWDQSNAEFWREERERQASIYGSLPALSSFTTARPARTAKATNRAEIAGIVATEARRQLGEKWVSTALRIAHVESRFNHRATGPKTRHGRALGTMQVLPGSARKLGFDPRRLHEPHYGVQAGIAHMRACIASGVRTERQMAACHVAGPAGWQRRLARKPEKYKLQYVAMVTGTRLQ